MLLSERALALIVDFEGLNQPGKWPGGASGITLGYGYDLGHVTPAEFVADWAAWLPGDHVARLRRAIGKTGEAARALSASLADIRCTVAGARHVLVNVSLPVYAARTRRAFPGFDFLPLDVQGALVSLVYNRGTRMTDSPGRDDRREMRAIRDLVANGLVVGIAEQIRSMKRFWQGKGLDGLLRRRDAEAALVESAIDAMRRSLHASPAAAMPAEEGASRSRSGGVPSGPAALPRAAGAARGTGRESGGLFGAARKAVVIGDPATRSRASRTPRARRSGKTKAARGAGPRPKVTTRARRPR